MKPVSPTGKPVLVNRPAFNEIRDVVDYVQKKRKFLDDTSRAKTTNPCEVMILNGTDEDLRQWDSLALYYPMVTPVDRPEYTDFLTFVCDVPTGPNDPIAVASEPIPAGAIGWAVVGGMTSVYLMRDAGNIDRFAAPQEGSGILLAGKSGYPIAWEESGIPDGTERIALILLGGAGGNAEPAKRSKIVTVGDDTLTVNFWTDGAWGTDAKTVCKPYLLRRSITARGGQTFTYSNAYTRVATQGASTENQVIVPSYVAGDEIYTGKVNATGVLDGGGDEILDVDLNGSARAWAKV